MGQWVDYRCRLGSLGNSFTATVGGRLARAIVRPSGLIFSFVPVLLLSILIPPFLPFSSVAFPCASVWESTFARVPHFL